MDQDKLTMQEARLLAGYTQTALAVLMKKSTQTIRNYETGVHGIPDKMYEQLKEVIGDFKKTRE